MIFTNGLVNQASNQIVEKLGGNDAFVGMHLRLSEGIFKVHKASSPPLIFSIFFFVPAVKCCNE